jgi:hypothetical protein
MKFGTRLVCVVYFRDGYFNSDGSKYNKIDALIVCTVLFYLFWRFLISFNKLTCNNKKGDAFLNHKS